MTGQIPKVITKEEYRQLREAIPRVVRSSRVTYYKTLLDMGRYAGLRNQEACLTQAQHINFEQGYIIIPEQKNGLVNDKQPIPPQLLVQLSKHLIEYDEEISYNSQLTGTSGYIFFNNSHFRGEGHKTTAGVISFMKKLRKAAGLDKTYAKTQDDRELHEVSYHSLRHLYITYVYEKTKDIRSAQKLARHKSIHSTLVYEHSSYDLKAQICQNVFT